MILVCCAMILVLSEDPKICPSLIVTSIVLSKEKCWSPTKLILRCYISLAICSYLCLCMKSLWFLNFLHCNWNFNSSRYYYQIFNFLYCFRTRYLKRFTSYFHKAKILRGKILFLFNSSMDNLNVIILNHSLPCQRFILLKRLLCLYRNLSNKPPLWFGKVQRSSLFSCLARSPLQFQQRYFSITEKIKHSMTWLSLFSSIHNCTNIECTKTHV